MSNQGIPVAMSALPTEAEPAAQLLLTHCAAEDSLRGQEGFDVRARSTDEPELLALATRLSPHEIPPELWGLDPLPHQTPSRLALLRLPDGRAALALSSYLPHGASGRLRSHLTHVLVYRQLGLLDATRAWGSPDWQTNYPRGASRELRTFPGLPVAGLLDEEVLASFLDSSGPPSPDQTLSAVAYPSRLASDPGARRGWLRLGLAGLLRVLAGGNEGRLYLDAEPGLVALLVYAAARLLPAGQMARVTFSTYENLQGAFWRCPHARVVGTWTGGAGLDATNGARDGVVVSAFGAAPVGLTVEDVPPIVDRVLHLATEREESGLADLHALWARDPALPADRIGEVLAIQPARDRLQRGQPTREDLLLLAGSTIGLSLLNDHRQVAWPFICVWSVTDPALRKAFEGPLKSRASGLADALKAELGTGEWNAWLARWQMVRGLLEGDRVVSTFAGLLERLPTALPFNWRLGLLREWRSLHGAKPPVPPSASILLGWQGEGELNALAAADLPAAWIGQALWSGLASGSSATATAERVRQRPEFRNALAAARPPGCVLTVAELTALLGSEAQATQPAPASSAGANWERRQVLALGAAGLVGCLCGLGLGRLFR